MPEISNVMTKETIKVHMHRWILKGFDQIQVGKDDEVQYWPSFGPGVPHTTDWRQSKQQDRKLEIDLKDIKIYPYHRAMRDQDTTPLTEEMNRVSDLDQEIIRDQETIMVQDKLEWMSIEIRMDTKPEANREAEVEELFEIGTLTTKKENKAIKIEINHFRKGIKKDRGEDWGYDPNDKRTKHKKMQKDPPNNYSDRDSTWTEDEAPLHQIATSQPIQPVPSTKRILQLQVQPKQQTPVQVPRQRDRRDAAPNQDDIDEQEILLEKLQGGELIRPNRLVQQKNKKCNNQNFVFLFI
ncbi:MAG: hypothetical protein EZS28_015228 [Streblomastix strix]|uniref:Uncharacterized protein n=1 Tax=Streblomastix strix TaxID=222440 RepID=A0A5J4W2V0_9EUKA|nr:MAG: hypothetical protein EZS28_015228 [Streblomastix strix]